MLIFLPTKILQKSLHRIVEHPTYIPCIYFAASGDLSSRRSSDCKLRRREALRGTRTKLRGESRARGPAWISTKALQKLCKSSARISVQTSAKALLEALLKVLLEALLKALLKALLTRSTNILGRLYNWPYECLYECLYERLYERLHERLHKRLHDCPYERPHERHTIDQLNVHIIAHRIGSANVYN
jgi:hypothetical protein